MANMPGGERYRTAGSPRQRLAADERRWTRIRICGRYDLRLSAFIRGCYPADLGLGRIRLGRLRGLLGGFFSGTAPFENPFDPFLPLLVGLLVDVGLDLLDFVEQVHRLLEALRLDQVRQDLLHTINDGLLLDCGVSLGLIEVGGDGR